MQLNALAVLDPSFFQTNVVFGGGGVQGEAAMEMARNSAQTKADASIAKARTQVLALGGSIEVFQNPVVEEATQVLSRKRKARPRRAPSLRRPSTAKTCGARARRTRPRLRRKRPSARRGRERSC